MKLNVDCKDVQKADVCLSKTRIMKHEHSNLLVQICIFYVFSLQWWPLSTFNDERRFCHFLPLHLNFPLSARTLRSDHMVSFRSISPIFLRFLAPGLCHSYFLLITHRPVADEPLCNQNACAPSHFSAVPGTPPLTCIDNDCCWNESIKAASLTRLQNTLIVGRPPSHAVHYASLIANHPTDTRHVHYGTDGFRARVGCQSQVSFGVVQAAFGRICRWIGPSSSCVCRERQTSR